MKIVAWTFGLILLVVVFLVYKNSRFSVETPEYRVVENDGPFEIREYPALSVVQTPMPSADVTEGSSFMRLFRYISGSNEAEEKISMTTPVLTSERDGDRRLSFIVPAEIAVEGAPRPTADEVELGTVEGGRFASYRFGGGWDRAAIDEAVSRLEGWMQERGLEAEDEPLIANYDPPFTPAFLRRNEILVRVRS